MESIFTFLSYKAYLESYLKAQEKPWGIRTKLCESMGIHNAYLSQVLKSEKNLSLEQAERLARFLALNESELNYWLLLVQFGRAGSKSLADFFEKQLLDLQAAQLSVVDRLGKKSRISEQNQAVYYSSWHYAAVHTALLTEELRTVHALAKRLRIDETKVNEVLEFLLRIGIIGKSGQKYVPGQQWIRLPKTSPLITHHHANVRFKALQAIQERKGNELHYGGFFTLSKSDFEKIQDLWLKTLKTTQATISASPSDEVYGLCIDAFEL